jgi:hypothetical protein
MSDFKWQTANGKIQMVCYLAFAKRQIDCGLSYLGSWHLRFRA